MNNTIAALLCFGVLACQPKPKYENPDLVKVDSFYFDKTDLDEISYLTALSDSDFVSFSYSQQTIFKYRLNSQKVLKQVSKKQLFLDNGNDIWCFAADNKNGYIITDDQNQFFKVDTGYKATPLKQQMVIKPFLKENYILTSITYHPFIFNKNNLFTSFYYKDLNSYTNYFKEKHALDQYEISSNEIKPIGSLFVKPQNLIDFEVPVPYFCSTTSGINLIYPCFDTLYRYDYKTKQIQKQVIGNRDYILPEKWDYTKLGTSEFSSFDAKYRLNNFSYNGMYFNGKTQHYLFFYTTPEKEKTFEKKLKLLVTDSSLKNHRYFEFIDKDPYPLGNFSLSNNGFTLMNYINKTDDPKKPNLFHIYNF